MSVRKIVSHLLDEGYAWKGKSISKSAVHRWLQEHKDDEAEMPAAVSRRIDVEQETYEMFVSCKKIFKAQLNAINESLHSKNGDKIIDTKALYALLGTAKALLNQLELHMKTMNMGASAGAIQTYINEYNSKTVNIINIVIDTEIQDETTRSRLLGKLAEAFINPPQEVIDPDTESS